MQNATVTVAAGAVRRHPDPVGSGFCGSKVRAQLPQILSQVNLQATARTQLPPIPLKERRYQGFVGDVVFLAITERRLASSLTNAVVGPLQEGNPR